MTTRERVIELLQLKARFRKEGDKTWKELAKEIGVSYPRVKLVAKEELKKMVDIKKAAIRKAKLLLKKNVSKPTV